MGAEKVVEEKSEDQVKSVNLQGRKSNDTGIPIGAAAGIYKSYWGKDYCPLQYHLSEPMENTMTCYLQ